MVQRFGDILDGKRTWQKELAQSNVRPTLPDAVAGDITVRHAVPRHAQHHQLHSRPWIEVVPGFAAYETLLYSPELKFYSNRIAHGRRAQHERAPVCTAWATPPAGRAA